MTELIEIKTRLLQRMPIFGGIDAEVIELLMDRARSTSIAAGDFFFREGSSGTSAFVLEQGSVSILKFWCDEDFPLQRLEVGSCSRSSTQRRQRAATSARSPSALSRSNWRFSRSSCAAEVFTIS